MPTVEAQSMTGNYNIALAKLTGMVLESCHLAVFGGTALPPESTARIAELILRAPTLSVRLFDRDVVWKHIALNRPDRENRAGGLVLSTKMPHKG